MNALRVNVVIVLNGFMAVGAALAQNVVSASPVRDVIDQSFRALRDERGSIAGKSEEKRLWRDRLIEASDAHPDDPARWEALVWAGRFSFDLEDWSTARAQFMRVIDAEQAPVADRMRAAERVTGTAPLLAAVETLEPWQLVRAYEVLAMTFPQWEAGIDPRWKRSAADPKGIQIYASRLRNAPGQTAPLFRVMMAPDAVLTPDRAAMLQRTVQECEAYLARSRGDTSAQLGPYEPTIRGMVLHCLTLAHACLGNRQQAVEQAVRLARETPDHPEARRLGSLFILLGNALCGRPDRPWVPGDTQELPCLRSFLEGVESHVPPADDTWILFHQRLMTMAETVDDREAVAKYARMLVDSRHPTHAAYFTEHPERHVDVLLSLSNALIRLQRSGEAVPYLQLLTQRYPSTAEAAHARRWLRALGDGVEQAVGDD